MERLIDLVKPDNETRRWLMWKDGKREKDDLLETEEEMLDIYGIGLKAVMEIKEALENEKLSLRASK